MAAITTDIVNDVCVPWGVFSSFVMEKAGLFSVIFVNYLLPLALMIFCYFSIVCSLRNKVTRHVRDYSVCPHNDAYGCTQLIKAARRDGYCMETEARFTSSFI